MTIKIGINGFGRIGRMVFRAAIQNFKDVEVVAINDLLEPDYLAYMLKYDSVHGRFKGDVAVDGNTLIVNGKKIRLTALKDPAELKWGEVGADIVVESTGLFLTKETCQKHLAAGAKKVIQSAPSKDDTPMFVYGVNHTSYKGEAIISNASCTTNCLAPVAKVLHDSFGIKRGLMTTIHAYTNDQNTQDAPHPKGDLRRARAAAQNIVPNSTGAAKAIGLVLPQLKGKLDGSAQRVPVLTGSLTELTCLLGKKVTVDEVNAAMKAAANESYGYIDDPIVSSDIIGMSFGSLFDATQTKVLTVGDTQIVRTVSWYDNEMSYVNQLVRTVYYFARLIK